MSFSYRGVECKETLGLEPTPANIKYAQNWRATIYHEIKLGTFNYANHFPGSKKCQQFGQVSTDLTFGQLLDEYLETAKKIIQPSTYINYKRVSKGYLYPTFGKMRVIDLKALTIRQWIKKLGPIKIKTVKNILIPMRHVLNQALSDQIIPENPLDKIVLTKIMERSTHESDFEVDPFSEEEIAEFLSVCEGQIKNLFQFAFFTGLRTSELIALEWKHIDWKNGVFKVEQAMVERTMKTTKTKSGIREVMLHPPALEALLDQKQYSYLAYGTIFLNPLNNQPWVSSKQLGKNAWYFIFRKLKIRYRNMYQTRHTFGSMMVSAGENVWWLAAQMGHKNPEMIMRHYGKWIKDNNHKAGYKTVRDWGGLKLQKNA